MMKLVEETAGAGELLLNDATARRVQYSVSRFQGVMEGSGLPVPGLHRIEGAIHFQPNEDPREWVGVPLQLKLEDGRVLGITLLDSSGRILSEGHGPSRCFCC
jgi:hypothetical protein